MGNMKNSYREKIDIGNCCYIGENVYSTQTSIINNIYFLSCILKKRMICIKHDLTDSGFLVIML